MGVNQKPWVIYGLFDPREPYFIEYIGFTTQNPLTRLGGHISKSKYNRHRTPVSKRNAKLNIVKECVLGRYLKQQELSCEKMLGLKLYVFKLEHYTIL